MPIYEFVCGDCGHEFEKILSFSATTAPACTSCGAANVTRQMGRPAIHFKGSGWYITDSKKGSGKNGSNNPASATTNGGGESSGESGGDSPKAESSTPAESSSDSAGKSTAKESSSAPAKTEAA